MLLRTLNKIQIWIDNQLRTSRLRRFLRHNEEAAQLEVCKEGLNHALAIFGVRGMQLLDPPLTPQLDTLSDDGIGRPRGNPTR
jgi:hypothetical protein